ncbi:MAG: tyrosine-type recombinase/integrase [Nostoc sp.]|uniref:tyrosine-type recombinase/integrase n=1 Tax=Nostoc sp. TaxID=1180 RepID=UPI002FF8FEB7
MSQQFYSKRQAYKGLGRSDTPDNQQWADGIARLIQADIDHPDGGLFDPTLAKYLDIKPMLATVTQLTTARALPKLGELWEEFCNWKRSQVKKTTYKGIYIGRYTAMLKPFLDKLLDNDLANEILETLNEKKANRTGAKNLLCALSTLSKRAIKRGILFEDYFDEIKDTYKVSKKSEQLKHEENSKAYTIEERNLIIQAFYQSDKNSEKHIAPLIEFLFLTGCRHGEVFALQWKDIKFDTGWIVFDESYASEIGETQSTKTDTVRIFKMKGLTRLQKVLNYLKTDNCSPNDLVFKTTTAKQVSTAILKAAWLGGGYTNHGKHYKYLGVVARLAEVGKIKYLKAYATRHTFISIMANNGADLALLADSCGNSVEVIIKHYLQPDKERVFPDI